MEIAETYLERSKQIRDEVKRLENEMAEIDSIKARQPYYVKLQALEDERDTLTDETCSQIDDAITKAEPLTFNIKITVKPDILDVDYDIDDVAKYETLKEFMQATYMDLIKENIDGILNSEIKSVSVTSE